MDLRFYLSVLGRRLPLALTIAVAVCALIVGFAYMLPTKFRASAKILVEAPQIPSEMARSSVAFGPVEQLQILQQQITTRDDLIALADRLQIYAGAEIPPKPEDIVEDMRSRISMDQVLLDAQGRDMSAIIFDVSFTSGDPLLAARAANELATMILARNLRQRTDRAGNTLQFFNQEVARLGTQLSKLEADILKFKTENKDTLPESVDFRRNQQSSLQERLVSLEREESDLRSRRSGLIATYTNTGNVSDASLLTPEQQMLADLNRALAEQLALFSETSPNIATLRARIATLQAKVLAQQPKDPAKMTEEDEKQVADVAFGLDLQLSDVDQRLQAIARERATTSQQIDELTRSITATPASETVLNALERNRENIQTQYNAAIARRAEASTGEQIEIRSDGGRISLLEAATPPLDPVNQKRSRIMALGPVAGLGLGLGVVFLLEMLNRTIRRPVDITKLLQTQPLATIPEIRPTRGGYAIKRKRGLAALLSAAFVPACILALHHFQLPLDEMFRRLIGGAL